MASFRALAVEAGSENAKDTAVLLTVEFSACFTDLAADGIEIFHLDAGIFHQDDGLTALHPVCVDGQHFLFTFF
jgi:hypothetical protein